MRVCACMLDHVLYDHVRIYYIVAYCTRVPPVAQLVCVRVRNLKFRTILDYGGRALTCTHSICARIRTKAAATAGPLQHKRAPARQQQKPSVPTMCVCVCVCFVHRVAFQSVHRRHHHQPAQLDTLLCTIPHLQPLLLLLQQLRCTHASQFGELPENPEVMHAYTRESLWFKSSGNFRCIDCK